MPSIESLNINKVLKHNKIILLLRVIIQRLDIASRNQAVVYIPNQKFKECHYTSFFMPPFDYYVTAWILPTYSRSIRPTNHVSDVHLRGFHFQDRFFYKKIINHFIMFFSNYYVPILDEVFTQIRELLG